MLTRKASICQRRMNSKNDACLGNLHGFRVGDLVGVVGDRVGF